VPQQDDQRHRVDAKLLTEMIGEYIMVGTKDLLEESLLFGQLAALVEVALRLKDR